jgi:hypothetical protein
VDSRQRVEKQIRLVLAIYRVEVRRLDSGGMARFRDRAQAIFDSLAAKNGDDPHVMALLLAAKWEIRRQPPSAGGGVGEQAIDGGRQLDDGERLR